VADVKRIAELMEARKPGEEILRVEDLVVHYKIRAGWVKAVEGAKFTLNRGDTMGLVGESGCGKTTTGYSIAQLLPDNAYIKGGKIYFLGEEILSKTLLPDGRIDKFNEYMRKLRWKRISYIFQGAMNALNPVLKVGDQIVEAILAHEKVDEETARERVKELYKLVGIPPDRIDNYPHEYSGGMKQRAMIAMALALNPDLIIADEPTTALDVIVQDHRPGRHRPGQDPRGDDQAPEGAWHDHDHHNPRHLHCRRDREQDVRHVRRTDRREGDHEAHLQALRPPLHQGAAWVFPQHRRREEEVGGNTWLTA